MVFQQKTKTKRQLTKCTEENVCLFFSFFFLSVFLLGALVFCLFLTQVSVFLLFLVVVMRMCTAVSFLRFCEPLKENGMIVTVENKIL